MSTEALGKSRIGKKSHAMVKSRGVFTKTRLCVYHQKGNCVHGQDCEYAHDVREIKNTPDLRKTTLCEMYENAKCAKSSEQCRFAHGKSDLRATDEIYKTSLCRFWVGTGICSMGAHCRHAHGSEELRMAAPVLSHPASPDLPPGLTKLEDDEEKALMLKLLEKLSDHHIQLTSLPTTAAGTPAPGSPRHPSLSLSLSLLSA